MQLSTEHKKRIVNELTRRTQRSSQNQIAIQTDVSPATISQMINGNWEHISNAMWLKVKITLRINTNWTIVETPNFSNMYTLVLAAKQKGLSIAFSDSAGKGKSAVFTFFERKNDNTIYIECKNYWTKKSYVKQLLINSGLSDYGTTETLINRFIKHLKGLKNPLLIIDQFDKLKEPSLDLFMDFYNDLNGHCGFVISGVEALKKRIEAGVQREKIGYAELYSRIGRRFIKLPPVSQTDIEKICIANGVTDQDTHQFIYNTFEGDIRYVRHQVEKIHLKNNEKKTNAKDAKTA